MVYNQMSLINVICANYNNSKELEHTIQSYSSQRYSQKRLIIIDGGSSDGVEIIAQRYNQDIDYFISESDQGISDAFNKGLQQCVPGYVYFLGAGDSFDSSSSLEKLVGDGDYEKEWLVCGKVRRVEIETNNEIAVFPRSNEFHKTSLLFKMSLPHQGLLTSTLFFEKYGDFSRECKYAMDYELLLRAYHDFPHVIVRDFVIANWMSGGVGADKTLEVFKEYDRIKHKNKVANSASLFLLNRFILSKYWIKKLLRIQK